MTAERNPGFVHPRIEELSRGEEWESEAQLGKAVRLAAISSGGLSLYLLGLRNTEVYDSIASGNDFLDIVGNDLERRARLAEVTPESVQARRLDPLVYDPSAVLPSEEDNETINKALENARRVINLLADPWTRRQVSEEEAFKLLHNLGVLYERFNSPKAEVLAELEGNPPLHLDERKQWDRLQV